MSDQRIILGFDIGGTKAAVCAADMAGNILSSVRVPTRDRTPEEVLPELVLAGRGLLSGLDGGCLTAVGIGAPGPIDLRRGLILHSPNMRAWRDVLVRDYLSGEFGVPAYFDNDANAGALAEWFFGAGRGCRDLIYLTLSTGIGGGVIAGGRLLHGRSGHVGELGHVSLDPYGPRCNCGMTGCYEAFCGGLAVAQRMREELSDRPDHPIVRYAGGLELVDMVALLRAAREGEPYAVSLWDGMCLRHAQAIGGFLNAFNPERVVLGTIAQAAGEFLMAPIRRHLPRFCWPETLADCELSVSALGPRIGEYAGVCVALRPMFESGDWSPPC